MEKNSTVYKELKGKFFTVVVSDPSYDYIHREDLISAFQKIKEDANLRWEKENDFARKVGASYDHRNMIGGKIEAYQEIIDALNFIE